jgi:hypothetical protein
MAGRKPPVCDHPTFAPARWVAGRGTSHFGSPPLFVIAMVQPGIILPGWNESKLMASAVFVGQCDSL